MGELLESNLPPSEGLQPRNLQAVWGVTVASALALVIIISTTLNFARSSGKTRSRLPLPPGPVSWPIIGNLPSRSVSDRPLHVRLSELAEKYGPVYRTQFGSLKTVVVCSARYAELILKTHDNVFASRRSNYFGEIVGYGSQMIIHAPYGPYWRHARKVATLELLTNKRLKEFQDLRQQELLNAVRAIVNESDGAKAVSLRPYLREVTRNNITHMMVGNSFFGGDSAASALKDKKAFVQTLEKTIQTISHFFLEDAFPFLRHFDLIGNQRKLRDTKREVDEVFTQILEEHRQNWESRVKSDRLDAVDMLLTRPASGGDRGRDKGEEKPFDDDQVKATLLMIYLGATETSSASMEWTMAELLKNPQILQKAQDEMDSVVGRDRLVEEPDLPRLPYLQAIIKESMRLHAVVPTLNPHRAMQDCDVGEFHFPKDTDVLVHVAAVSKDPATWDRPLDFIPERFLNNAMDLHGNDFSFLPFGSGRRICLGKNLGLIMVEYALAVLLQAVDWTLPMGTNPSDIDMRERSSSISLLVTPAAAVATPRLPSSVVSYDRGSAVH